MLKTISLNNRMRLCRESCRNFIPIIDKYAQDNSLISSWTVPSRGPSGLYFGPVLLLISQRLWSIFTMHSP